MERLGSKFFDLSIFGQEFGKSIAFFEISILTFLKNEFLTNTVNFGIGSAFSKGPGSAFFDCPDPGQFYKAYPLQNPVRLQYH